MIHHTGPEMRSEREARKMTQDQMARRLDVSVRTYCRYESGNAPTKALIEVARLFVTIKRPFDLKEWRAARTALAAAPQNPAQYL